MNFMGGEFELAGFLIVTGVILAVLLMLVIGIGTMLRPDRAATPDESPRRPRKAGAPAVAR
jgi:hypothetical protein